MDNKKISIIALVVFALCVFIMFQTAKYNNTRSAKLFYAQGLEFAAKKDYQNAYYNFSKISKISDFYEIAVLKQALCALEAGDKKSAYSKFRYLTIFSKDKNIAPIALYNCALINIEHKKYKTAYKKLSKLYKKYPQSDYKKAASYQIGLLLAKKDKRIALKYFIEYLDYAPDGRYALSAAREVNNLNLVLSIDENYAVANALYAASAYKEALKYISSCKSAQSAFLCAKIYEQLNNPDAAKEAYIKGLCLSDEKIEPKEVAYAVNKYFELSKSTPAEVYGTLMSRVKNPSVIPAIIFEYASYLPRVAKIKKYETIYQKYPDSYQAAQSLWNVFWYNYKNGYRAHAKELAYKHISLYKNTNSTPRIKYWLAKILLEEKRARQGEDMLKALIKSEPDSYYSYVAQNLLGGISTPLNTKKRGFIASGVSFSKIDIQTLFDNDKNLVQLALLGDIDTIKKLRLDDDFIKSYIAFKENNIPYSVYLAKQALNKREEKISFSDIRYKLAYPIVFASEINKYSKEFKQNPYLMLALIREESTFNAKAQSPVGALGLMQLMPSTAQAVGLAEGDGARLFNPDLNIKLGIKYFSNLYNLFNQNEMLAVLSYNGGPGNVSAWKDNINHEDFDEFLEDIPYSETQNYIKKVFGSYWNYTKIYCFYSK